VCSSDLLIAPEVSTGMTYTTPATSWITVA